MAKLYDRIDERLRAFISEQPMFFVATAPQVGGHINLSPKGCADTFSVIDDHTIAYLELYGSGAETVAHLRENGRIIVMFCSFGRTPKILRLHGTGRVVRPDAPEFSELASRFGTGHPGMRSIIVIDVTRVADSCGYAVPQMDLVGERTWLDDAHGRRTPEQWPGRVAVNFESIDGLPALDRDHPVPLAPSPLSGSGGG